MSSNTNELYTQAARMQLCASSNKTGGRSTVDFKIGLEERLVSGYRFDEKSPHEDQCAVLRAP